MWTSADTLLAVAAVALGGAVGASLRYVVEVATVARWGPGWPWGTLLVNVFGSLVLGVIMGTAAAADLPRWATLLLATGFCGALTTFSSFALQVLDLSGTPAAQPRAHFSWRGLAYAAISLGAGLLAAVSVPALFGALGL